jgi:hypothetical protein
MAESSAMRTLGSVTPTSEHLTVIDNPLLGSG